MRARFGGLCIGLVAAAVGAAAADPAPDAKPAWLYGHDLRVRKPGAKDFDKATPRLGVEVYRDAVGDAVVAIAESGNIAAVPAFAPGAEKKAAWLFGNDLRARKGDETAFATAPKFGVEAFQDGPSGKLLYATSAGTAALADRPAEVKADRDPAWHHALALKVRKPGEKSFAAARKFGVEAFKDGNTGGLIYVSETGSIATAPAPAVGPDPDKVKAPTTLYGLELRTRKAGEPNFGPDTKTIGVEVYRDENTGGLIYVSEAGSIATAPAPAAIRPDGGATWTHAMDLKARPGGESDFAKANRYGVEAFRDDRTGHRVYVADIGAIAILPGK